MSGEPIYIDPKAWSEPVRISLGPSPYSIAPEDLAYWRGAPS